MFELNYIILFKYYLNLKLIIGKNKFPLISSFKARKITKNPILALTKNLYEKHLKSRINNVVKQWNLERSKSLSQLNVPTLLPGK